MGVKMLGRDDANLLGWFWCRCGGYGPQPMGWYGSGGDGPEPMGWYTGGGDGPHPFNWFWHAGSTPLPLGWYIGGGDGPTPFMPGSRLSPPWITLWNEIRESIGSDPLVSVSTLDQSMNPYVVHVTVDGQDKADAITSLLRARYQFGNISVVAEVKKKEGGVAAPVIPQSANELAQQVRTAFGGNRFYVDVVVKDLFGRLAVYPVFARAVIQFKNDDLSDLHGNYNAVVAAVFAKVLTRSSGGFSLLPSTAE
jgi:hypothetical protein